MAKSKKLKFKKDMFAEAPPSRKKKLMQADRHACRKNKGTKYRNYEEDEDGF